MEEKPFEFPDGGTVLITAGDKNLTVAQAVYMLEDVKYRILKMMWNEE